MTGITGLRRGVFSEAQPQRIIGPTNTSSIEHIMPKRQAGSQPTWTDVKAKLANFDRLGLVGLIQDLYTARKITRRFFTPVLD